MKRLTALLALAVLPALPAQAASCQVSVTDLPFGPYRYDSAEAIDTTGTISMECTDDGGDLNVNYDIALSAGYSGNYAARVMAGDGELQYNVFVDGARTRVWGDGNGASETVSGSLMLPAPAASHAVYARIPASQTGMGPGAYADQLTVFVTY